MYAALAHLQEYWGYYAVGAAIVLPLLFMTRKYSMPVIQFALEFVIYSGLFHVFMVVLVYLAKAFKENTQMTWRDEDRVSVPWNIPLKEFWDYTLYEPGWVFYFEIGVMVLILIAMLKFRPMKTQRKRSRRRRPSSNRPTASASGGSSFSHQRR